MGAQTNQWINIMNKDVIKSGTKSVSRLLDIEEVEAIVSEIQFQHELEIDFLNQSKMEDDEETINSIREDAYLANLTKIREAKRLTREQFIKYEVDKQTCCGYNDLVIPTWEDYNK
jgi:hypothetical protein